MNKDSIVIRFKSAEARLDGHRICVCKVGTEKNGKGEGLFHGFVGEFVRLRSYPQRSAIASAFSTVQGKEEG